MRVIQYLCDWCGEGVEQMSRHLSLHFGGWSGYVKRQENGRWKHVENSVRPDTNQPIKQFCTTRCLSKYLLRPKGGEHK